MNGGRGSRWRIDNLKWSAAINKSVSSPRRGQQTGLMPCLRPELTTIYASQSELLTLRFSTNAFVQRTTARIYCDKFCAPISHRFKLRFISLLWESLIIVEMTMLSVIVPSRGRQDYAYNLRSVPNWIGEQHWANTVWKVVPYKLWLFRPACLGNSPPSWNYSSICRTFWRDFFYLFQIYILAFK